MFANRVKCEQASGFFRTLKIASNTFFPRTSSEPAQRNQREIKLRGITNIIIIIYNLYNGKPPALGRWSSVKPLSRAKYDVRSDGERVSERERDSGRRREENSVPVDPPPRYAYTNRMEFARARFYYIIAVKRT